MNKINRNWKSWALNIFVTLLIADFIWKNPMHKIDLLWTFFGKATITNVSIAGLATFLLANAIEVALILAQVWFLSLIWERLLKKEDK